ncbi:MAG: NAD-dependent epimerase/dehydratase family protein [Desulfatitalea sp.]|nr:NAD-dependent epimerase/dehydratase family protein [Desulfatitalea sp.]
MRIAVTGAFGYSGRYITERLLQSGHEVITLTNALNRPNPFGAKVTAFPFHFNAPGKLRGTLQDVHALINNIAWSLRHLPVVGVFGDGDYRLQPIYVGDLAQAAAQKVSGNQNEVIEAIGPETFTYTELVAMISRALGVKRPILSVSPSVGYWVCRLIGFWVNDVVITREEIQGLMEGRLCVDAPPLGVTQLTDWIERHRDTLGRRYTSEMSRRVDRLSKYQSN